MLTAAQIRTRDVLGIFRDLGYPIAPIAITPEEWRRAGVEIGWNGTSSFHLIARLKHFDLFRLQGDADPESLQRFLRSYRAYNVITKSALIHERDRAFSIYDLGRGGKLRRLDVDLDDPSPHAVDRLNLLAAGESIDEIFDLALDRESITRRFFAKFRDAVRDVAAALPGDGSDEALLILSRLLFLSFVQEKGWLNGERRFLFDRLGTPNYFANVLRPLFFGCLNTAIADRDNAARLLGKIPYLNGGLFEPSPYEVRHPDLQLPDELVRRVITGVFERFDFSSDEDDVAGTHVDPEMLGKVFESLMAEDERAASGSFYTPREIVNVLTERAIREWLGDGGLARLDTITILDPACGSGAFLLSALTTIERITRELGGIVSRQTVVERSLYGVDVKPEAVRLCELRLWLAIVSAENVAIEHVRPLPNLDRNIMQGNSLLSPIDFLGGGRGEIYRDWVYALRAQADLVERYRRAPGSERPVLARLLRRNDRSLASDLLAHAIDVDERELQQLVAPQHDLFGRALIADRERCLELQERIAANQRVIEDIEEGTLDFFSFDVHFAPVMARGGFDIVAGNPPWVRNARIDALAKRMIADRYALFRGTAGGGFHQPDLSVAFFERATSLVAPGGVVSMLMPAKITNASYAAPLRRAAERMRIVAIDDWSNQDYFDADTFPLALTVVKGGGQALLPVRTGRSACPPRVHVTDGALAFDVDQCELRSGSEWALVPPDVAAIFRRMEFPPLAETLGRRPLMGVKTGDNRAFFLSDEEIREFRIPPEAICRCVRGRDVRRWSVSASQWMLWPPRAGWKKPPKWLARLAEARGAAIDEMRLAFVRPEHVGIKVAWKDVSRGMAAVVLPDAIERSIPLIPNQTLYFIDAVSLDEAYAICAVLNSTIADALLVAVAERAKDAHFRYFGRTVARMPLPRLDDFDTLVRLSRRAHQRRDVREELDRVVAARYGVSEREIQTLRAFVDHRLAR
jgi:hypothetical protein